MYMKTIELPHQSGMRTNGNVSVELVIFNTELFYMELLPLEVNMGEKKFTRVGEWVSYLENKESKCIYL